MNRRSLVENLIYLILTYVQASLVASIAMASPNLEPNPEAREVTYPTVDTSGTPQQDSLSIPDENDERRKLVPAHWQESVHDRVSFVGGVYVGPHFDEANQTLYILGGDYILKKDPSDKIHVGFKVSSTRNPFLYVSRELYLRNYLPPLKSWSPILQLELDSIQGFGAPVAFNYYSAGAGVTFYLYPPIDMTFNFIPISSRGISLELLLSYLAF